MSVHTKFSVHIPFHRSSPAVRYTLTCFGIDLAGDFSEHDNLKGFTHAAISLLLSPFLVAVALQGHKGARTMGNLL